MSYFVKRVSSVLKTLAVASTVPMSSRDTSIEGGEKSVSKCMWTHKQIQ